MTEGTPARPPYELPDFHPEDGHLHTCNRRGPCNCAGALYSVAAERDEQVSAVFRWIADTGCVCPGDYLVVLQRGVLMLTSLADDRPAER